MKKSDNKRFKRMYRLISSLILLAVAVILFAVVWCEYINERTLFPFAMRGNYLMVGIYFVLSWLILSFYGGLRLGYERLGNLIYSQILSLTCINIVITMIIALLFRGLSLVWVIAVMELVQIFALAVCSFILNQGYIHWFPPHRMLMLHGRYEESTETLIRKMNSREDKYQILESISWEASDEEIKEKISGYQGVVMMDLPAEERNRWLKYCYERAVRVYLAPSISDIIIRNSEEIHYFDTPLLLARNSGLSLEQKAGKRLMDLLISGLGILISSPFMLIIAVAIKLYDGGPVFFRQERVTYGGKRFMITKFRSMIVDAEKEGHSVPATEKDPRITPVGRVIRATRLDELPQLLDIFRGDMSIVGPRPERVEHVQKYTEEIPEFSYRLKVKGGLTGLAQIYGKYNTSAYDKLKLDLMYIENYSLLLDIKLILMTIKIMFLPESTEGFSQEKSEEMTRAGEEKENDGKR